MFDITVNTTLLTLPQNTLTFNCQLVGKVDAQRVAILQIPIIIGTIPLQGVLATHLAGTTAHTTSSLTTPQVHLTTPQLQVTTPPQTDLNSPSVPNSNPTAAAAASMNLLQPSVRRQRFASVPVRSLSSSLLPSAPPISADDPPPYSECVLPDEYKDVRKLKHNAALVLEY